MISRLVMVRILQLHFGLLIMQADKATKIHLNKMNTKQAEQALKDEKSHIQWVKENS